MKKEKKTPTPTLVGPRVVLRPLRKEDKEARQACGMHPDIVRGYASGKKMMPMSAEQADEWYGRMVRYNSPTDWMIDFGDTLIGRARLDVVAGPANKAHYIVGMFNPSYQYGGLDIETTRLVLDYGFNTLGLHRIDVRVLDINLAAQNCYAECGFSVEGREHDSAFYNEQWHDEYIMAIVENAYREAEQRWQARSSMFD